MASKRIYVQMRKRVHASPGQVLRVKDVARLLAEGEEESLENLPVFRFGRDQGSLAVVELMDVLEVIRRRNGSLDIESVGLSHTIVELKSRPKVPAAFSVALVWLILFVGSGLAIMNFHTDVSMKDVHERIYYLMTGVRNSSPLILQIPYSIGIGLGMILFFNHLFKRKFNDEPSPLELEVFLYQENLDQYVIDHEKAKQRREDPYGPE
ncbi:stage V sporulation protein AA [Salinithrix halophila]|uniref:Stage V sporulation protein AA n=1 Tax=Salinithrix halophila TaxID=1485204 RepID=A0ABV8JGL9_9BACL